jgi:hypothetical protein
MRGASPSSTCPAFTAALQSLDGLLAADRAAQGLPHGDPAHARGTDHADAAFAVAVEALGHAARHGVAAVHREAAAVLRFAVVAEEPDDVEAALDALARLAAMPSVRGDRMRVLALDAALERLGALADVWAEREAAAEAPRAVDAQLADAVMPDAALTP